MDKIIGVVAASAFYLTLTSYAFASAPDWSTCSVNGVATLNCVPVVFQYLLNAAFVFAGITCVIFIFVGGYRLLFSGGDPKQLEGARQTITYAIIGLILILLSVAFLNFISLVTGVSCIRGFGFTNCN